METDYRSYSAEKLLKLLEVWIDSEREINERIQNGSFNAERDFHSTCPSRLIRSELERRGVDVPDELTPFEIFDEESERNRLRMMSPSCLTSALETYLEETAGRLDECSGLVEIMLDWAGSTFPELFSDLWLGLYHVTSVEGWKQIQKSGYIKPSSKELRRGNRRRVCYAERRGAVALFDFGTFPMWKIFRYVLGFRSTLNATNPKAAEPSVWLHLDRPKILGEVQALDPANHPRSPLFLPYFEAHHVGPISLTAVTEVSLVKNDGRQYQLLSTKPFRVKTD